MIVFTPDTSLGGVRILVLGTGTQTCRASGTRSRPYGLPVTAAGSEPMLLLCHLQDPGGPACPNFALWLQHELRWGPEGPSRHPSSFCSLLCVDSYPFLCRTAPENPTFGRRTPLPYSGGKLLPIALLAGGGGGLVSYFEEHFPLTCSSLLSLLKLLAHTGPAPPHSVFTTSASIALVWTRITRESWLECSILGMSPKILIQRVTSGAWESEFLKTTQWILMRVVLRAHFEKLSTQMALTFVGLRSRA